VDTGSGGLEVTESEAQEICCGDFPLPHGWVQWKGTNVCMDVQCICGHLGHVDDDFTYYYKCHACQRMFAVDPHVRLLEVSDHDEGDRVSQCQGTVKECNGE